jgi:aspartate/methionine/tyrosine aminotransferase
LFRKGKASQYTHENIALASGGRLALSRAVLALSRGRLGYMTPDYPAYQDLIESNVLLDPIEIPFSPEDGFALSAQRFIDAMQREDLSSLLISNPCNPTGRMLAGDELARLVAVARGPKARLLILDEFYSHFVWDGSNAPVSGASHVEDVNRDRVLLIDGLTKNYRYPGWRCGWIAGPKDIIETITNSGSFLDGGPPRPIQRAAMQVLEPARADQETTALRQVFAKKRQLMLDRLAAMGVRVPHPPEGTFYVFGDVAGLPASINTAETFFRAALAQKVLTVPGWFFDIDPHAKRGGKTTSRLNTWLRFSFGSPEATVVRGLDALARIVKNAG